MGVLILFASWEDRFRLGFDADLAAFDADEVVVFYFGKYAPLTEEGRKHVRHLCAAESARCDFVRVEDDDLAKTWRRVVERVKSIDPCSPVLLDVTTMPREIVWYCMWALDDPQRTVRYVYHSPKSYGEGWLSRNPMRPRLVYKLSGVSVPDGKTALLLTVGFDAQRVQRVLDWLEPPVILVGTQTSSDFERNDPTMQEYREKLEKRKGCSFFELDVYSGDHGFGAVVGALDQLEEDCDVVMTSLGPKISAVTLYCVKRKREKVGLIYTPAGEYNLEYSKGIGRTFDLRFPGDLVG